MNKTLKWILIIVGSCVLLFLIAGFIGSFLFDLSSGKNYSKQDLVDNYEKNKSRIYELVTFYKKVVPKNKIVIIEFENSEMIARLVIDDTSAMGGQESSFQDWNLKIGSRRVDSLMNTIGWTSQILADIKSHLDKANCISIANSIPVNIGFQRSGFGEYYYDIFSKPLSDSLKKVYNDSCTYISYNDSVVLEYEGGAVGPQCFPEMRQNIDNNKRK